MALAKIALWKSSLIGVGIGVGLGAGADAYFNPRSAWDTRISAGIAGGLVGGSVGFLRGLSKSMRGGVTEKIYTYSPSQGKVEEIEVPKHIKEQLEKKWNKIIKNIEKKGR